MYTYGGVSDFSGSKTSVSAIHPQNCNHTNERTECCTDPSKEK